MPIEIEDENLPKSAKKQKCIINHSNRFGAHICKLKSILIRRGLSILFSNHGIKHALELNNIYVCTYCRWP